MSESRPIDPRRERGLPPAAVTAAREARAALVRGRAADAEAAVARALRLAPAHPELLRLGGVAMAMLGRHQEAIARLRGAAATWPDDALVLANLGAASAQGGDLDAAVQALRRATELDPTAIDPWFNLARAHEMQRDSAGAEAAYAAVLELDPARHAVRVLRANALGVLGRLAEAEAELRTALRAEPRLDAAWVALSNLRALRADGVDSAAIARLYAAPGLDPRRRAALGFALAGVLEAEARNAEAFAVLAEANAMRRADLRWDAGAVRALVDAILAAFDALPPPPADGAGRGLVFLVGMPRSGSTLVEQILAAHPDVAGGGETELVARLLQEESKRRGQRFPQWVGDAGADDWTRLGADYLARIAPLRGTRAVFTDKTLPNWQLVGAIARMLPGARFVHCVRDPLETCWSCWKHNFGEAQYFAYDLAELVAFHRDSVRAMAHWRARSPAPIHALVHETLLDAPEAGVRELLAHCGLDFDPVCLRFHEAARDVHTASVAQVRRPLRRDTAVTAAYGALLDPLRALLREAGLRDAVSAPGPKHDANEGGGKP